MTIEEVERQLLLKLYRSVAVMLTHTGWADGVDDDAKRAFEEVERALDLITDLRVIQDVVK